MFNLQYKIHEKRKNRWKTYIGTILVLFVFSAPYAFGADVLFPLRLKGGHCLIPQLTGQFQTRKLL